MRYVIRDAAGAEVNRLVAAPDKIEGLLEEGQTYEVESKHDESEEGAWLSLRQKRARALKDSDWSEGADLAPEDAIAWRFYRARLRDLPETEPSPHDLELPSLIPLREIDPVGLSDAHKRLLVNLVSAMKAAEGFLFQGTRFDFSERSVIRINGASTLARTAIDRGTTPGDLYWRYPDREFGWIAADNSIVPMDAQTCYDFGEAAADHESAHVFAAKALKDMPELPSDWIDGPYWP